MSSAPLAPLPPPPPAPARQDLHIFPAPLLQRMAYRGDLLLGPVLRLPPPLATARKYLNIFRASLVERMAYRGDFLLGTVLRFLPVLTTILLWEAVYAGSGQEELSGFTRRQMIAYLLLIHISRMFSSMPGLASGVSRDIRA